MPLGNYGEPAKPWGRVVEQYRSLAAGIPAVKGYAAVVRILTKRARWYREQG